ncbi:hypothetical protein AB0E69_27755 [Kribbella sp. NPDC026611]|uniref:hypothetical protein n=1 Tax=Kribbella sp. NPDC026611 TaxID=3154911 RepID=UPI0033DB2C2B
MTERYDQIWLATSADPFDHDERETFDVFYDRVYGLMPHEHEWLTLANTLKDAVSAHEVYLTKVLDEVLLAHRVHRRRPAQNPSLSERELFFDLLGVEQRPESVRPVTSYATCSHIDAANSEPAEDRLVFAQHDPTGAYLVELTEDQVLAYLQVLGNHIREIDPVLWLYACHRPGSIPQSALQPVADRLKCQPL